MATHQVDQQKKEAFAGQMLGILNGASLAFMTSVGHQTGLFDTMAELRPSTSEEIAKAAGLNERYVREWLGGMVTGRVVEYDAGARTYRLPPEHGAYLTRAAGPDNMAFFSVYFALIGQVEQDVVQSFKQGGGVPYSRYPRFQELQREETARVYDATLVDVALPLVPGLVERLRQGIEVLDVGCGAGHAVNLMARAFPNSRFAGYDFSKEGVARGSAEAKEWGLTNARFEVRDAAALDEQGRYDLITTFDVVHDLAQPRRVVKNIATALKAGGMYLMQDIAASSNVEDNVEHPLGPTLYAVSTFHCMTVSLAQGGEGLGTVWGDRQARQILAEAGFTGVDAKQVPGDFLNTYYIASKG